MAQLSAYTCYFDASGHPSDQPFVVVSGYVANYYQWQNFDKTWEYFHSKANVRLPFHAADFMARGRDDYKKWAKEDAEADKFLRNLCMAQQTFTLLNVTCIVDMGVYRQIDDVFMLQTMIPAYALGARACVALVESWKKQHNIDNDIECVFEDGDFGRGKFIELMRGERMPAPIFKDKKDFPGLQAADHMAWEVANLNKKRRANPTLQPRDFFARLLAIPHIHIEATLDTLLELCERKGIKIRRGKIVLP